VCPAVGSNASLTVNTPAVSNANGPYSTCTTAPVYISATTNRPGTWSGGAGTFGSATSASTTYTPTAGEVGTTFNLTWTTSAEGVCPAVGSNASLTVNPLPTVSCGGPYGPFCSSEAAITLGGSPGGGTWSGSGVSGGTFDPSLADSGPDTLTYSYTDGNGCFNSCTSVVTVDGTDSDGDATPDCTDGCPFDSLKTSPGVCGCGVVDADDDGDGAMNCNDLCPNDPNKVAPGNCGCGAPEPGTACDDGDAATGNDVVQSNCTCAGQFIDCLGVPGGTDLPGTPCDDGVSITANDTWDASCVCAGDTVTCSNALVLELNTDLNGTQTTWEIRTAVGNTVVWLGPEGPPYGNNSTVIENICLDNGCYVLKVYDSFGDGMTTGGYVLRYANGDRLIDNTANGMFGTLSQAAQGFCLPISDDRLTPSTSDRTDLQPGDWVQANVDAAVSAQYGVTNSTSGYQFWFFNPNGGYSRRVFISHAYNNYWFTPGPTRASYLKMSSLTSSPLPVSTLLDVRVRTMVAGVYGEFGPAVRITLVAPTTQLVADISSPNYSCGLMGIVLNSGQYIHTVTVSGAAKYQWEFTRPGYSRRIASTSSALLMNTWTTNPLQPGLTYNVRVRVSFDGTVYGPYGNYCTIGIATPGPLTGGGLHVAVQKDADLRLWPNPNRGEQLYLSLSEVEEGVTEVQLEIHDLFGKLVLHRTIAADAAFTTVIDLSPDMAGGLYTVDLIAGSKLYSQRLIIE
jgi:hypothetical protein